MTLLVQHGFLGFSGVGSNYYVNTFHLESPGAEDLTAYFAEASGLSTVGELVADAFHMFYEGHSGTAADTPIWYYSRVIANLGEFLKIYDLDAAAGTPPVFTWTYASAPSGMASVKDLPAQVSLVMSVEGFGGTVINRPRRRNRIYLGPLNVEAIDVDTPDFDARPHGDFVSAIVSEYNQLISYLRDTLTLNLVVYSKTDDVGVTPTKVWVDDSFDIQRRRKSDSTGRVSMDL